MYEGTYCLLDGSAGTTICTPVPYGYFSTPVYNYGLVAGNTFIDQAAAITGTAANGGLTLATPVGGACSTSTVGCTESE